MSESAEPASEAVEVEESEKRAPDGEDQPQQQQSEEVEAEVQADGAEAKGEIAEDKCEEVVPEAEEQEQVRMKAQGPEEQQDLEVIGKQEKEEEEDQNEEEKQEKPLEDSQETMQLPVVDTSQGAIEDEEMPSMVTLSSPSRMDESEMDMKQEEKRLVEEENISQSNPPKEDEDSDDSVCVIGDDDDEDEEDDDDEDDDDEEGEEGEEIPFDEDEEGSSGSEDEGSEESDQRYTDNYERRRARVQRIEEQIDDEEEAEDGEDIEDDFEADGFDGESNDVVLRHSNDHTKHSKELSAALQDPNLMKGPAAKKINVNPFSQKARMERNQTNMERPVAGKQYTHVQSKVKQYIMDLSELRRLSTERRKRSQEEARYRHQDINEIQLHNNEELVMTCKTVKDYTEKGLQEVAECEEESEVYQLPQCLENGEISIFPRRSMGNGEKLTRPDDDGMDVDPIDVETIRHEEKVDRINGTINERKGIHRREEYSKPVMNGEDPTSTVCDLRTLTYEEYMKGPVGKGVPEEIIEEDEEVQQSPAPASYNDNAASLLRIDNVTSIYQSDQQVDSSFHDRKTPPLTVTHKHKSTETLSVEDPEVNALKTQLQNRNTQFESLRDAYQKTVSENLAMKVELENLRKMVSYLQEQNKQVTEKKTTAIQTEVPDARSMPSIEADAEVPADPRLATTSMISAMSSQWTDSIGSALVSMEPPPNVTNALNSDESSSQAGKTPSKQKNAFSRAFMTSSRILQTLSNITHGRSKQSRQSKERARKLSSMEKEPTPDIGPSNPKKRKATDTLEISSSAQPFKIPHKEQQPPNAQENETVNLDDEDAPNGAAENDNPSETDAQEMLLNNDDVKVFVYPEDESGQEHSFLIQAREIGNTTKPGVRECGPYLLGNVEVYMTEMNGTINIWGKELNQSSAATSQNADEMETSTRSKELKTGLRWQSTPRIFNEGSASTGKKSRVLPRFTQQQKQHLCEVNNTAVECDSCHSHGQRLSWPSCNHESQRGCCPAMRADEIHCGCGNRRSATGSCCRLNRYVDARRFSMNDAHQTHSPCCCHGGHQVPSRSPAHQSYVRRHSFEPTDDEENAVESADEENDQYSSKAHLNEDSSAHSYSNGKLAPPSSNRRGSVENSDSSLFINDNDPLLGQRQTPDVPENSKRRLRGKKVRGLLMDLLKGCGDCRTSNPMNKTSLQHNASVYAPSTSVQHKIACPPNQPACSLRSNDKCSSCQIGTDKTAEFEAQLEYFRSQMDKLRSHSDNLREMLDTLRKDNLN